MYPLVPEEMNLLSFLYIMQLNFVLTATVFINELGRWGRWGGAGVGSPLLRG